MRILQIITALGVGGAENLLLDVCAGLIPPHEVTVVFLKDKRRYEEPIRSLGADVRFVDLDALGFLKTVRAIRSIVREKSIEVVHTHLPAADTIGRLAALRCKGVKVFSSIHNTDLWMRDGTLKSWLLKRFNRFTVNRFKRSRLIAVSRAVKDYVMETGRIRGDKIDVVYNFVNVNNPAKSIPGFQKPSLPQGSYILLMAARLHWTKGHDFLFEAMETLIREQGMDDLQLLALGEGDYRNTLRQKAAARGLTGRVHFLGARPNVYDYMRAADLLVLPSVIEGFGLALLEAMYCRLPVLASDIPVLKEVLGGGAYGSLFKSESPADLACQIAKIRSGAYDLETQKERGRAFCLSLTRERHMAELMKLYGE